MKTKYKILLTLLIVGTIFTINNGDKLHWDGLQTMGSKGATTSYKVDDKFVWQDTVIERAKDGVPVTIVYKAVTDVKPFITMQNDTINETFKMAVIYSVHERLARYVFKRSAVDFYFDYQCDPAGESKHVEIGEQIRDEVVVSFQIQGFRCEAFTLVDIEIPANIFEEYRKELKDSQK